MATSPARRRDRRRYLALSAVTVLTAALALPAFAAGPAVPAAKKTTKKKVVPRLGASCTKSQLNSRYGTLSCRRSGSSYKWVRVSSSSSSASSGSSSAATTEAATDINPSQVDVITLVNGSAPASYALKVDVKCNGLAQTPKDAVGTFSFGPQGGTNQTTFKLSPPNVDNPTGSTCAVTSTSSGGSPSVRLLINGRPATNPSTAATATTPDFTAEGPYTVTALVDFGGSASAPSGAPAAATTTTTVASGAATTTIAPPASGKAEVGVRWAGIVPAAVQGIDVLTTCTSATAGGPFQNQLQRFSRTDSSVPLALVMAPASGTFGGTSCQITGTLIGGDNTSATLRIVLRGNTVSGPSTGSLINSPAFAAPGPWQATVEVSYGGATTSTTGVTTTTSAVTTTTLPPKATVSLARTGTAPIGVTGYVVDVACNNISSNGNPLVFANWNATFPATGATAEIPFTFGASSTCSVKVTTNGGSTGNVSVALNGTLVGTGPNGAAQTATLSTPTPFTAGITIAY